MKLSNISLGLAVAASSLVGISAIASDAKAASIYADNTSALNFNGVEFSGLWEFSYVGSYGNYQSNFGVRENGVNTTFFKEVSTSNPGSITGPTTASYTFDFGRLIGSSLSTSFQTAQFFLETVDPSPTPTIFSKSNSLASDTGFYIATTTAAVGGMMSSDPAPNDVAFQTAINTFVPQGYRVIGVNDGGIDKDYNDMIVKARPVPVPAIVPGIALAAAFFGSKALKRNKKVANESVA